MSLSDLHDVSGDDGEIRSRNWPLPRVTLWVVIAALALVWDGLHWRDWQASVYLPPGKLTDFSQEWLSARNFFAGRPVYSPQPEAFFLHTGTPVEHMFTWNAHPPVAVLLALPFGRLSYRDAHCAWTLSMAAFFLLGLVLAARQRQEPFQWQHLLPLTAALAVCFPLQSQFLQGQLNGLLAFLIVAAWWADRRGCQFLAGACIGLAAAAKLFPAFLFLYWLMQKKWRALLAGLIAFLSLNLAARALFGVDAFSTYAGACIPYASHYRSSWGNVSLTGFWLRLFNPEEFNRVAPWIRSPQLASGLIWASQAAVAFLTAVRCRQARTRPDRDRALGLTVTAMLLVSPVTWDHYFLILLMPLSVEGIVPVGRLARAAFFISVSALWAPMLWFLIIPLGPNAAKLVNTQRFLLPPIRPWQSLVGLAVHTYALLVLFYLGWHSFRDSPGAQVDVRRPGQLLNE